MHQELIIALLAGLGGMLGWGLADFFAKKTIDEVGDIQSLAWAHVFGTGFFFIIAVYKFLVLGRPIVFLNPGSSLLYLIFFGVLQAIIYILVYRGFGKGQVSILNPVFASFSGIAALISIVGFGEVVSSNLVIALVIIFGGVLLINTDFSKLHLGKFNFVQVPGFKEIAAATALAAVWTVGWDKVVGGTDWVIYSFLMYAFMTVAILLFAKVKKVDLCVIKKPIWKFLLLIGFCETVAYLAISLGYSATTKTSVIALLSGAFSLPTIFLARSFLKERVTVTQTIGGFVIVIGIILLSVL
ncbi:MAG TPA: EamA family transporter [Candidatus Paceibacterota bacterium]|nr:EamA family transporter [Candidatus Paceibacterota bacterium]